MRYPEGLIGKVIQRHPLAAGSSQGGVDMEGLLSGCARAASLAVFPHDLAAPNKYVAPPPGVFKPMDFSAKPSGPPVKPTTSAKDRAAFVPTATRTVPAAPPLPSALRPFSHLYLDYVPGFVTVAPLGNGVFTGPMSGCYICVFTYLGIQYVAHVGTATVKDSPESLAAKRSWLTFLAKASPEAVVGGTPLDYFGDADVFGNAAWDKGGKPEVACYVSPSGEMYALLLANLKKADLPSGVPLGLKVLDMRTMRPQAWKTIEALRTWQTAWFDAPAVIPTPAPRKKKWWEFWREQEGYKQDKKVVYYPNEKAFDAYKKAGLPDMNPWRAKRMEREALAKQAAAKTAKG